MSSASSAAAAALLAAPSTPQKNKISDSKKPHTRRSRRVLDRDPVIAPGYGTRKDLLQLSSQLELPLDVVEVVMKARGRGLRSRGTDESEAAKKPPAVSSAWADFMSAEGVGTSNDNNNDNKKRKADDAQPIGATRSATKKSNTEGAVEDSHESSSGGARNYVLPAEWEALQQMAHQKAKKTVKNDAVGGGLLQAGTLDAKVVGRTKLKASESAEYVYHCPVPTRLLSDIQITKIFTGCNAVHSLALAADGTTYAWGRNEAQQLGLPKSDDTVPKNVYYPTAIDLPAPVQTAALGKSHTIVLLQDQTLHAVGANKVGQCSVRNFQDPIPHWRKCIVPNGEDGAPVTWAQLACGEDFTVALSTDGHVYSCGCSQYGQLGTGETGEYFVSANKLDYANVNVLERRVTFCHAPNEKLHTNDTNAKVVPLSDSDDILIQNVACGKHHTVLVEACSAGQERPRVFSFGCGDYGCLGHGAQKDEYFPRVIGTLQQLPTLASNVTFTVSAGAHCSLLKTHPQGHVYYWGKTRLSGSGDAVLRPQLVDALAHNSHNCTHAVAGGQTVVCTTSLGQTVAWGQGGHGELGLGHLKRSSAKPAFVERMDGIQVLDCAAGYGHVLYIGSTKDDKKKKDNVLEELPQVEPDDVEGLTG